MLTSIFIMGASLSVMFYAKRKGIHDGLAGILANGIGLSINIDDMKKAGGKAFVIGFNAAILKALLGLVAVYLVGAGLLTVGAGR